MSNTSPSYAELLALFGDFPMVAHGLSRSCHALAALMWQEKNLEVLRNVDLSAMMLLAAEVDIGLSWLEGKMAAASAEPDETGYSERDILTESLRGVRALKRDADSMLMHLVDGTGEHLADVWMRQRDERLTAEAAENAMWAGFEQLREFDRSASDIEDRQDLWSTFNALVEAGVPMSTLLRSDVVEVIYCHITEPNAPLGTDHDDALAEVLDIIGMPYDVKKDELILHSDGDGWNFKKGRFERGWTTEIPGLGGWRQVPTSTLEEAHLALLACSDGYWELMPARLKHPEFIREALPRLFNVESVEAIPRPALRDKALEGLAGMAL